MARVLIQISTAEELEVSKRVRVLTEKLGITQGAMLDRALTLLEIEAGLKKKTDAPELV